jgi:hypothetical protein
MTRLRREGAVLILLAALGLLLGLDLAISRPIDPFAAPAPLALWSGQAATGGHCALPQL